MKKVLIGITTIVLAIVLVNTISYSLTNGITINSDTFSLYNKDEMIKSKFDSKYNVNITNNSDIDKDLKDKIVELTKKTTYLLMGAPNVKEESSEDYYKRHQDYLKLRYNPVVPKDNNSITGLDQNSQEYKDDVISGMSVPGIFSAIQEMRVQYNSYGRITVTNFEGQYVVGTIILPNVKIRQANENDPTQYKIVETDLKMYYYFKELDGEYKLYYIFGETADEQVSDIKEEKENELIMEKAVDSYFREVYNFSKADEVSDEKINSIYEENKNKIVVLNAMYNTGVTASANGFFINKGIIITTYKFVEKALLKGQNIVIGDMAGNTYKMDGIVTMNEKYNIAILKVQGDNSSYIEIENIDVHEEDGAISLSSRTGVGLVSSKGIIISANDDIQTSIAVPEESQGSPLFNVDGKIIGMANSKMFNGNISFAVPTNVLKEYYNIFAQEKFEDIKAVTFSDLKEDYYIKKEDEKFVNNVPEDKMKEYSNVEDAENLIELQLVKKSYKDGIISLRFKNEINTYIDTLQLSSKYVESLKSKGYKENYASDSKKIYSNDKFQIIIMKEFNYLIVVMVRVWKK